MKNIELQRFSSLQEALNHFLKSYGDKIALIEADRDKEKERLTHGQVRDQALSFAGKMKFQKNMRHRMGIIMSNQSKWLIAATGLFFSGGTLVPLDYKLTAEDQLKLIVHSKIQYLTIEFPFWKKLKSIDHQNFLSNITVFVTEAPLQENIEGNVHRWEKPSSETLSEIVSSNREDVACIVYSSGTGGTPKGCMMTHGNYLAQAQSLSELYPIDESNTYFSFIPTNHAIDFMCGFLLPLFFGSKIVHQRTLRPEFFATTIKNYKISHMALVPLLLKTLEQRIREQLSKLSPFKKIFIQTLIKLNVLLTKYRPHYRISRILLAPIHKSFGGHLRFVFAGGAFVESSTAQFFYDLGIPVVIGYGLTEAGTVLTVNDLKPFRPDTVGKPLSITKIQIHNPNEYGVGEVWASGPTVMKGYLDATELTEETIEKGWLKTGDLGKLDRGHLILLGRMKNMIVTQGGKNVYPEDIETTFDRIENIEEYCILAKRLIWPSSDLTHDSMVIVVRSKENIHQPTHLEEIKIRNRKLADYKRVANLVFWEGTFPRTASMKIKRNHLAEEIKRNEPSPETKTLVQL
jgi:long-chain acyl-CoA synthetase